jgi:membrane fusion protein (multidrug efflux system)
MKREAVLGLVLLCSVGIACHKKEEPKAPPPPAGVVVTTVQQMDVPVYGEWIGTTAGDINADIRPNITGYLMRRAYQEGSFVHQGQRLFEIDPRQFQAQLQQAQANLGQGQASLAKAERDVARYKPLAEQHAISQQDLDNAISAEQVAAANVASLKAAVDQTRLYLEWTHVNSPIAGIAGVSIAQVGDLVSPQTALAVVSRLDPLRVQFNLSEQEYLHFREQSKNPETAQRISVLQMVLADGSVFQQKGRLIFTDRQVDVKTGTITAVGLFPNPDNVLRPGQYAKVRAETSIERGALLVPQRAVNELQGGYQVAVVGPDDKADIRNVQVGQRVGQLWVIHQGLKPGERVVVDGFSRVKAGATVKPTEAPPAAAQTNAPAGANAQTTPNGSDASSPGNAGPGGTGSGGVQNGGNASGGSSGGSSGGGGQNGGNASGGSSGGGSQGSGGSGGSGSGNGGSGGNGSGNGGGSGHAISSSSRK